MSLLYKPIIIAIQRTVWSVEDLNAVGAAMQGWQGPGAIDGLDAGRIKDYIHAKPPSIGATKKRDGPPRFRSWQIIYAAELLLHQGGAIGRALDADIELEDMPTCHERATAAEARVAVLETEKASLTALLVKAADAKRKADERKAAAVEKKAAAKAAKAIAAKAKAAKQRAEFTARVDARVAKKAATVTKQLELAAKADVKKREEQVSKARARARKVEDEAALSKGRLKRARKADANVKDLKQRLDEAMEQLQPPDSPMTDDEPGEKFTPLPWKAVPVIWGQLGRRTPPTAINQNITDALRTFAEEKNVPLPCVDEIRRMRGSLTVAGECLAAFRVALARRIISFGFDESTKFGISIARCGA